MSPQVILYTRPSCGKCPTAKYWLEKNNVNYTEVNIDDKPALEQRIVNMTGFLKVPAVDFGDRIVEGLNFPRLAELLV